MKRWFVLVPVLSLCSGGFVACATSADGTPGGNEADGSASNDDAAKAEGGGFHGDSGTSDGSTRDSGEEDATIGDAGEDGGELDAGADAHDGAIEDAAKDATPDAASDAGSDAGADAATDAGASPTVTDVVVTSTLPNNGAVPYNTGTSTLTITGTNFSGVTCPSGVALDDLDGAGNAVSTNPASCTVDSPTQITAVFPAGIRTNGATGWNVLVTNGAVSNTTSAVKFVPRAGLLISEVLIATSTDNNDEFVEIYNPTANAIDTTSSGIGLKLHQRASTGTDTSKTLTLVSGRTGSVPSHGFLLFVSNVAITNGETWTSHADASYAAAFGGNNAAYISLSGSAQTRVIDKVGWGTQSGAGVEGNAISPTIATGDSVQRKPAGGAGDATDTDDNSADFDAQSAVITPKGSTDPVEP